MPTADRGALVALRKEVVAGIGTDRALDVRILANVVQPGEWSRFDIDYACADPNRTCNPPRFTGSLEATLDLVDRALPGVFYLFAKGRTRASEPLYGFDLRFGSDEKLGAAEHDDPCRCALTALLTALIAQMEAGHGG